MALEREIASGRRVDGALRLPPSKSVTNRYLNLALLSGRPVTLERPLVSEDTHAFSRALEALGWTVEHRGDALQLLPGTRPAQAALDCGASGTMARFLTASLTTLEGSWLLDGSPRLRQRPLAPLLDSLGALGAQIESRIDSGFLPLQIRGGALVGGSLSVLSEASSQYVSALLMAATAATGRVRLQAARLVSAPYVDLTVEAMRAFGARVAVEDGGWTVDPGMAPAARYRVEGDVSAAGYFAAAAALTGGQVELEGVKHDSAQGDRRFLNVLEAMGAELHWRAPDLLVVSGGARLEGVDVDMSEMPDQVPTLAALAPFAAGTTTIRNVAHLRIKESDRLAACGTELRRVCASVEELPDGLVIQGVWSGAPPAAEPVRVATYDDHRIAMSFAILGLRRPGVRIAEPEVVAKSYPAFWEDLERCLAE